VYGCAYQLLEPLLEQVCQHWFEGERNSINIRPSIEVSVELSVEAAPRGPKTGSNGFIGLLPLQLHPALAVIEMLLLLHRRPRSQEGMPLVRREEGPSVRLGVIAER
jgi:hypothetical protein